MAVLGAIYEDANHDRYVVVDSEGGLVLHQEKPLDPENVRDLPLQEIELAPLWLVSEPEIEEASPDAAAPASTVLADAQSAGTVESGEAPEPETVEDLGEPAESVAEPEPVAAEAAPVEPETPAEPAPEEPVAPA